MIKKQIKSSLKESPMASARVEKGLGRIENMAGVKMLKQALGQGTPQKQAAGLLKVVQAISGNNPSTGKMLAKMLMKGGISTDTPAEDPVGENYTPGVDDGIAQSNVATDVTEENGCMRMLPGSHKKKFKQHKDTFDANNLLTRGQTIENVPFKKTIPILLKAGQLSLHHPKTIHGSGPNLSKKRRIGFAIQSYIATNVKQRVGKVYVQLARGQDDFHFHEHTTRPKQRMNSTNLKLRDKANLELQKILYKDSKKIGKY